MRLHVLKALAFLCAFAAVSVQARPGAAQAAPTPITTPGDRVDGHPAGVVGLGLLGAEVGLVLVPTLKLEKYWWAWALLPTVGAAGGAVAGVFALDGVDSKVDVALIGVGAGLVVPAIVGALAIKSRRERQAFEQADRPAALRFGRMQLDAPSLSTAPVYTASEQTRWGVRQRTSLSVSLLSGRF